MLTRVTTVAATQDKAEDVIDQAFANPVTLTGIMTNVARPDFDENWACPGVSGSSFTFGLDNR